MQLVHSLIFLLLAAIASGIAGFVGSLLLMLGGSIHYPVQRALGRVPAFLSVTLVNGFLLVAWTAAVMLWLKRGTPPYHPMFWAAILAALMLITAPAAMARRSSLGVLVERGFTQEQGDLFRSLNWIMGIQVLAAIFMLIDQSALDWWRWLPFSK